MGVQGDAIDLENMCQQNFRVQTGRRESMAGEIFRGPGENAVNGPGCFFPGFYGQVPFFPLLRRTVLVF